MTGDGSGLPTGALSDSDIGEVDTLLQMALASIPRDGAGAAQAMALLMDDLLGRFGYAGVYRAMCTCVRMVLHETTVGIDLSAEAVEARRRTSGALFVGYGATPAEAIPDTPVAYAVSRFAAAVADGDEPAAAAEFDSWQPDRQAPPTELSLRATWDLLQRAWSRQAGGDMDWHVEPTGPWPPDCDWCCKATAVRMFRCRPFDMTGRDPNATTGAMTLTYTDADTWYGCRTCAPLVEQDRWSELMRRNRLLNPGPHRDNPVYARNLHVLWQRFRDNRIGRRSVRLPRQRPAPGNDPLNPPPS